MRKLIIHCITVCLFSLVANATIIQEGTPTIAIDTYSFVLLLNVPQVKNNTTSEGTRKFETQKIRGEMYVNWLLDGSYTLTFGGLGNTKFKVGGIPVSYQGEEDRFTVYSHFNYIGNNRTEVFKTPCLCFYLELLPSYAIGKPSEDNSFYLMLAGKGLSVVNRTYGVRIVKSLKGYAAGTQGCGCMDYHHKSPTRSASPEGTSDRVDDVVATYGTWKATWKHRKVIGELLPIR